MSAGPFTNRGEQCRAHTPITELYINTAGTQGHTDLCDTGNVPGQTSTTQVKKHRAGAMTTGPLWHFSDVL